MNNMFEKKVAFVYFYISSIIYKARMNLFCFSVIHLDLKAADLSAAQQFPVSFTTGLKSSDQQGQQVKLSGAIVAAPLGQQNYISKLKKTRWASCTIQNSPFHQSCH